jgi:hypothetical protein
MASETTTPNIGLQVPAFNQANWQVPTNFNWNLIDLIFGGTVEVPALWVAELTAGNISGVILPPATAEVPAGAVPGSAYTLSHTPNPVAMLSLYLNGAILRLNIDYTVLANIATLNNPTSVGDTLYAQYFHS